MPNFEKTFADRTTAIEGGLAAAETKQAEADAKLAELNKQLAEARHEAARIREEAREQGAKIVAELREQAQAEAARIVGLANTQIEAEQQQVLARCGPRWARWPPVWPAASSVSRSKTRRASAAPSSASSPSSSRHEVSCDDGAPMTRAPPPTRWPSSTDALADGGRRRRRRRRDGRGPVRGGRPAPPRAGAATGPHRPVAGRGGQGRLVRQHLRRPAGRRRARPCCDRGRPALDRRPRPRRRPRAARRDRCRARRRPVGRRRPPGGRAVRGSAGWCSRHPALRDALSDPARSRGRQAGPAGRPAGRPGRPGAPQRLAVQSVVGEPPHGRGGRWRSTRRSPPRPAGTGWSPPSRWPGAIDAEHARAARPRRSPASTAGRAPQRRGRPRACSAASASRSATTSSTGPSSAASTTPGAGSPAELHRPPRQPAPEPRHKRAGTTMTELTIRPEEIRDALHEVRLGLQARDRQPRGGRHRRRGRRRHRARQRPALGAWPTSCWSSRTAPSGSP